MARIVLILFGCAILVGIAGASWVDPNSRGDGYLACAGGRVVAFGPTHEVVAIAEMAAIARWMEESQHMGERYENWALAQDRSLQCRRIGRTANMQCKISAVPCRPRES